jgi:hypothetical protein
MYHFNFAMLTVSSDSVANGGDGAGPLRSLQRFSAFIMHKPCE